MQKLKMVWFSVLLGIFSVSLAQESDFDEWLELDLSDLMNIKVTTATKKNQLIHKVPATVRIVTADQIKERAYHNLEDVLQDLPGFQFRNIQSFNSYSFLRGAPSQNNLILVLVDGIQINELNSGGFYGGYQYNLQNVKQIEVVYGPSSALYGTNAISGIINIITKDAEESTGGEVSITGGSFNTFFSDGIYQYHPANTELHASVAAFYKQTDKAELGGAAGDWNWSEDMENYEHDFGLDSKVKYKNTSLGLILQDKHASRTTYYKSIGTDTLDRGTDWHIRFLNAYLSNVYNNKTNWSLKSQLYYRNSTVMDNTIALIDTTAGVGQVGYYRPNWLFGLEEQLDYSFNSKINLITGLVLERENLAKGFSVTKSGDPDTAPAKPTAPGFNINTLVSFYLQAQIELIKYTELTTGVRRITVLIIGM
jgi:outer membrane receptor protein involved in Fe transport